MPHYRLYTLNLDNKIVFGCDYDFETDQAAIAMVREIWAAGERAEIWRGTTKLRPFTSLDGNDLRKQPPGPLDYQPHA